MRKKLKRLGLALLALCLLMVLIFLLRGPLLREAAELWIVDEPLSRADAIVVLGGGMETRPFEAARLFHQGLAPRILLTSPKKAASEELGVTTSQAELERRILLKKDVPPGAITELELTQNTTFGESLAVRNWARTNGAKKIIIPTDIFHSRRARWVFRRELGPDGVQVEVAAVPVPEYTRQDWWQHEEGLIDFQNEILKTGYYWFKY